MWLILTLIWLLDPQVLVLKNGKKITCDAYEVKAGSVHISREGQQFTVPKSLVDWDKTKAMTTVMAAKKRAEAQAKREAARAAAEAKKDDFTKALESNQRWTSDNGSQVSISNSDLPTRVEPANPASEEEAAGDEASAEKSAKAEAGVEAEIEVDWGAPAYIPEGKEASGLIRYKSVNGKPYRHPRGGSSKPVIVTCTINGVEDRRMLVEPAFETLVFSSEAVKDLKLETGARHRSKAFGGRESQAAMVKSVVLGKAELRNVMGEIVDLDLFERLEVDGILGRAFLHEFDFKLNTISYRLELLPPKPGK